jgi:hypothetical protein
MDLHRGPSLETSSSKFEMVINLTTAKALGITVIRMLLVGYCFGIRSERRLCEEVHLNLAYRWFCRLGLDGAVPDHSTFSKNRHGRFSPGPC